MWAQEDQDPAAQHRKEGTGGGRASHTHTQGRYHSRASSLPSAAPCCLQPPGPPPGGAAHACTVGPMAGSRVWGPTDSPRMASVAATSRKAGFSKWKPKKDATSASSVCAAAGGAGDAGRAAAAGRVGRLAPQLDGKSAGSAVPRALSSPFVRSGRRPPVNADTHLPPQRGPCRVPPWVPPPLAPPWLPLPLHSRHRPAAEQRWGSGSPARWKAVQAAASGAHLRAEV